MSAELLKLGYLLRQQPEQQAGSTTKNGQILRVGLVLLRELLRQVSLIKKPIPMRLEKIGRLLLLGLRIGASTVSIVLIRNEWSGGISAGVVACYFCW